MNARQALEHPALAASVIQQTTDLERRAHVGAGIIVTRAGEADFTQQAERVRLKLAFAGRRRDADSVGKHGTRLVPALQAVQRGAEAVQDQPFMHLVTRLTTDAKRRLVLADRISVGAAFPVHDAKRVSARELACAVALTQRETDRLLVLRHRSRRTTQQPTSGPRHALHGFNLQEAIDAPSWHVKHFPGSFWPRQTTLNTLTLESRFDAETIEQLRALGHKVVVGEPWSESRLSACSRVRDAQGRLVLRAAANPRGMQGYAVGR